MPMASRGALTRATVQTALRRKKKKGSAPTDHATRALHHALGLAHHLTTLRRLGHFPEEPSS